MSAILVAQDVSKSFGVRQALDRASLTVHPGEFIAVLGPSGSGKSTLFRCLTRLTEPDQGSIEIAGQPFHRLRGRDLASARRQIGVVFQQFNLVRRLSALDNVLAGRLAGAEMWRVMLRSFAPLDRQLAINALIQVGLEEQFEQRADTLSGGQQQRVAIARAIAQQSQIILADEPVASLDPETAVAILELLHGLTRTAGIAVVCTLHQPQLAQRFADRVLIMDAGQLTEVPTEVSPADYAIGH